MSVQADLILLSNILSLQFINVHNVPFCVSHVSLICAIYFVSVCLCVEYAQASHLIHLPSLNIFCKFWLVCLQERNNLNFLYE